MGYEKPVVADDDNPEWTEADFAKARPIVDFPEHLRAAFPNKPWPQGGYEDAAIRLDADVAAKFRATGPGWQARINAALRAADPLARDEDRDAAKAAVSDRSATPALPGRRR